MNEWGLDAALEARFGQNAASGHKRAASLTRELRSLDRANSMEKEQEA